MWHALFDPAHSGAHLALEAGNTVLTYTQACNNMRAAWLTDGRSAGRAAAEFTFWGEGSLDEMAVVGVGFTRRTTAFVGLGVGDYGLMLSTGKIYGDGIVLGTAPPAAKGAVVGVHLDLFNAAGPTVTWRINGAAVVTLGLPTGKTWYAGATVAGGTGYDLRCLANTGQRAFAYADPALAWLAERDSPPAVRLAERGMLGAAADRDANARYRGALAASTSLRTVRRLSYAMWDRGRAGSRAELALANADGAYDPLLNADMSGATLHIVAAEAAVDGAPVVATYTVDKVRARTDAEVRIGLAARVVGLDAALQKRLVRPDADPEVANATWPLVIGAARSITPLLIDAATLTYALTDGVPRGLGRVRDAGDPLDGATDYTLSLEGTLNLRDPAYGKLTADVSSVGGEVPVPPTDLLDGDGDMSSAARWTLGGESDTSSVAQGVMALGYYPYGTAWARHVAWQPEPATLYRITFEVLSLTGGSTYSPPNVQLVRGTSASGPDKREVLQNITAPGRYEVICEARDAKPLYFYIPYNGYSTVQGPLAFPVAARLDNVRVYELDTTVVDDDSLLPATLEAALRELLEARAGWQAGQWSAADARVIDQASGYAGIGYWADTETRISDVLHELLASYHASAYVDSADVLRIVRLVPPETVVAAGTLRPTDDLTIVIDIAPKLSTRSAGRRNWTPLEPADVVTDTNPGTGVPLAERAMLGRDYRITCAYAGHLPGVLAHARYAKPTPTLLDRRADIQAHADYTGALYPANTTRRFYSVPTAAISRYTLGQVWTLTYPRYGLAAGKPVFICGIEADIVADTGTLTCWG